MNEKPAFIRAKEVQQYGKTYLIRLDSIVKIEFGEQATILHLIPHGTPQLSPVMPDVGTPQSIFISKQDGEAICKLVEVFNLPGESP